MNELLKTLCREENTIAQWCPKVTRESFIKGEREDKLVKELEKSLDESQKVLFEKLLNMHIDKCLEYREEAFIAGARTAAKLIIEMLTDD